MATAREFELACPACDEPGIYAVEYGYRLRVGLTSNLSRFMRRHLTLVRLFHIVRLEPLTAPRAWRALLSHLRAQVTSERKGSPQGSVSSRLGPRTMWPRAWPGWRGVEASLPLQTSAALRAVPRGAGFCQTEPILWPPRGLPRARKTDQAFSQRSQARMHSRPHSRPSSGRSWATSAQTNKE
jgi:hypothetical protein